MDNVEMAQDSLEKAHGHDPHAHGTPPTSTRLAAVLVAVLAAVAVVVEMSGNDQQTAYLAHDVAASDLWSQYQGKSVRHTVMLETAQILENQASLLPPAAVAAAGVATAASPRAQIAASVVAAREAAGRLADEPGHDGMVQLSARASQEERARDHALYLHERLERSVRGMQIAIVLVGLFMATRLFWLLGVGGLLGAVAFGYGMLTLAGLI